MIPPSTSKPSTSPAMAIIPTIISQLLAGMELKLGATAPTRDFTFVTDIADAFLTAAESEVAGEIFNIGSGNSYSINRLVELLGGPITYVPKRPGEPDCTFADTSKIERILNWKAKVSFEDGVAQMLKCINDWQEAPLWDENSIAEATKDWFKYLK